MTIELARQIACVKREIALRERAYPKWVSGGRMKQASADKEITTMKAVLHTLMGLGGHTDDLAAVEVSHGGHGS